jgi:hypothetical protein
MRMSYSICGTVLVLLGILVTAPAFLAGHALAAHAGGTWPPSAYMIPNVPWHQQITALSCGDGALETVFDYWGPDISQMEIANVAESSSSGTYPPDVVRAGQFSYLSSAQGRAFPNIGPYGGYPERSLGYAAFSHSSKEPWLPDLKALVASDIPVIVLMSYDPSGGEGHYRVVTGYDDGSGLIYFSDPWGRDLNHQTGWTGVISWSYSDFLEGWDYTGIYTEQPYFGTAIMPWSIGVTPSGNKIRVTVTYPCPAPFDCTQYPAENARADIALLDGKAQVNRFTGVPLGTIHAGDSATVTVPRGAGTVTAVSAGAWGIVSGWVPEARWQGQAVSYPAYGYTDAIGGNTTAVLPAVSS